MRHGHAFTSEHGEPGEHGTPAILRTECQCGQLAIAAAPTLAAAQRKAARAGRHHCGFANAAGRAEP